MQWTRLEAYTGRPCKFTSSKLTFLLDTTEILDLATLRQEAAHLRLPRRLDDRGLVSAHVVARVAVNQCRTGRYSTSRGKVSFV